MRRVVTWTVATTVIVCGLGLFMAFALGGEVPHLAFPQGGLKYIEACSLSVNDGEDLDIMLPHDLRLHKGDVVRVAVVLPAEVAAGEVLAIEADEVNVRVWVDGQQVPFSDEPGAPRRVVIVPLPEGSGGRKAVIELQKRTEWAFYLSDQLGKIVVGRSADILLRAYYSMHGAAWLASAASLLLSLTLMGMSLFLWRRQAMSGKLSLFLLMFVIFSVWGLADNWLTAMSLGRALFWRRLSLTLESVFLVPVMLYFGECYLGKYRRMLGAVARWGMMMTCALVATDACGWRSMMENLPLIHLTIVLESMPVVTVVTTELTRGNRRDRLTGIGALILAAFGLFDIGRMALMGQSPDIGTLYLAVPVAEMLGAAQLAVVQLDEARAAASLRRQHHQTMELLDMQREHYRQMSDQLQRARRVSHDFDHYVALLKGVVETGDMGSMQSLLNHAESVRQSIGMRRYADSLELNAILSQAAERCDRAGIPFEAEAQWSGEGSEVYDVCIVLGNLLSNAIEAAEKCSGERHVLVRIAAYNQALVVRVENTKFGDVDGEWTRSTKANAEEHGLGLMIVREILKKYEGQLIIGDGENGVVRVDAVFGW